MPTLLLKSKYLLPPMFEVDARGCGNRLILKVTTGGKSNSCLPRFSFVCNFLSAYTPLCLNMKTKRLLLGQFGNSSTSGTNCRKTVNNIEVCQKKFGNVRQ